MTALLSPVARWMPTVKERLVSAILSGEITREDAIRAHGLSDTELDGWINGRAAHGRLGLAVTKIQQVGR